MTLQNHVDIKDLIFSEDWISVVDFYSIERLKWMGLFLLSPIWIVVKLGFILVNKVYNSVKDWPWFFIKFAISELVLVTVDIGSDTMQGIKLTL